MDDVTFFTMGLMDAIKPIGMHYGNFQSEITLEPFEIRSTRRSFREGPSREHLSYEFRSRVLDSAPTENATVCMCVCPRALSLERLDRSLRKILCMFPGAMARSSFGGVTIIFITIIFIFIDVNGL